MVLLYGERGDSLIQGICRCVRGKWFWSVSPLVLKFGGAQLGLGMALKNEIFPLLRMFTLIPKMGASIVILKPSSERLTLERPV